MISPASPQPAAHCRAGPEPDSFVAKSVPRRALRDPRRTPGPTWWWVRSLRGGDGRHITPAIGQLALPVCRATGCRPPEDGKLADRSWSHRHDSIARGFSRSRGTRAAKALAFVLRAHPDTPFCTASRSSRVHPVRLRHVGGT